MLTAVRVTDRQLLMQVISAVWRECCEHGAERHLDSATPGDGLYVGVYDGKELVCLVRADHVSLIRSEVHIATDPGTRPPMRKLLPAFKTGLTWIFENTPYTKLVGEIEATHKGAIALAKASGFTQEGRSKNAWRTKDGLVDVLYFGLEKQCHLQKR